MKAEPSTASGFQRILFCADFSESADFAFDFAVDATLRRPGATLYLLHVIPEMEAQFWKSYLYEVERVDEQAQQDIDAKIAAAYLARVPAGMNLKVVVRVGTEAAKIIEFAEETAIDLIVIGRQGSDVERALFGKVAEKVVHKAQCAVMVVPLSYRRRLRT